MQDFKRQLFNSARTTKIFDTVKFLDFVLLINKEAGKTLNYKKEINKDNKRSQKDKLSGKDENQMFSPKNRKLGDVICIKIY